MQAFSKKIHRRQSQILDIFRLEIIVQQVFKFEQDIGVAIFAGNELSVVKTNTVIEQQFDVVGHYAFSMFINRLTQFIFQFTESVNLKK